MGPLAAGNGVVMDLTGNRRKRPPVCVVTRAMADAGLAKLQTLVGIELEHGVTDEQLVCEVFGAMWEVYWEQVLALRGKNLKPPHSALVLPTGLVRQ